MSDPTAGRDPKPLWNPYLAGVGLGLVLLASFLIMGQGLGASGGLTRLVALGLHTLLPRWTEGNANLGEYVAGGENPLLHYLVFLGLGVLLGGYVAALTGRRIRVQMERGPHISAGRRALLAVGGGVLMGLAARLAHGCTSGQALSGGATLAAGSWAFMMMVFGGGYAMAYFVRRQWL
jgi:uncharacterized protein